MPGRDFGQELRLVALVEEDLCIVRSCLRSGFYASDDHLVDRARSVLERIEQNTKTLIERMKQ